MQRHPMTPEGLKQLKAEIKRLREVLRPQIVLDIEEARAHGDISENSEYEDAKERQSHCEGRIRQVESRIGLSEVIDVTQLEATDRVVFGTTVDLQDVETEDEVTYRIVGEDEADVKLRLISVQSPIARALIGKEVGDEAVVRAPGGDRRFAIIDVRYV